MCGIVGYIGSKEALPVLLSGLKRLEYRGYDSAGITIKNGSLTTLCAVGEISNLELKTKDKELSGTIGIGHTRWATHGGVSETNAHPHSSSDGSISIVHNGIIENFFELKEILISEGFNFQSETDSEVLANLIQKYYSDDLESAVVKALSLVKGTYGLVVLSINENKIIAARKGSPLVLGVGENELLLASDVSAIIEYTNSVIYLKDGDLISLSKEKYEIKDLDLKSQDRDIETVNLKLEALEKKGFKHFMLKEIFEQSETLKNVIRGRIKSDFSNVQLGGMGFPDTYYKSLERITFVACGTSWHACQVAKYLFERLLKIPINVEYASEFRYRNPVVKHGDLVIALSQSGETADTLAALREAKKLGANTLGIVNVVGSTISREVEGGIYLHAGPEIGVASTKAFTSQVMALHLMGIYIAKLKFEKFDPSVILKEMIALPEKIDSCLKLNDEILKIAKEFTYSNHFLYLGRDINFPVALEGALKLKEISYIHAEGYPAAEMKHGPIALIDKDMPVVLIANKSAETYEKVLSNLEEVKSRNGRIIVIASKEDQGIKRLAEHVIYVPETIDSLTPIINSIPLQLLAYHIADIKGCNVDKPRNLAKSVTVE